MPETPVCDLCASPKFHTVYDLGAFRMLRCANCGLVYRHPMPTDAELYEMYNVPLEVTTEALTAYYHDFRKQTFRRIFSTLREQHLLKPGARLLDVGVGNGWSLETAPAFGIKAVGIDLDINDLRGAAAYGSVAQGWSEQLPFASNRFDLLLSTDVLEHVRDPRGVLREMGRVLTSGGVLALRVPDAYSVLIRAMDIGYALSGGRVKFVGRRLYRYHLYGFGIKTLRRYLDETGYELAHVYRESSKNLDALDQKAWARNPVIRYGISTLTRVGEAVNREDEIIAFAVKR